MEEHHMVSSQMPSNPLGHLVVKNTPLMLNLPHKEITFLSPPSEVVKAYSNFTEEDMGFISTSSPLLQVNKPTASSLNAQAPCSIGSAPSVNPGFGRLNPTIDMKRVDWQGINSYLAGQVRPRPDGSPIYRCYLCPMEFPTAQALGGHLSSHTKRRKKEALFVQNAIQAINSKRSKKKLISVGEGKKP